MKEQTLKHVEDRVIVRVNAESKNTHTFSNGLVIRRERQYNELNRRITQPVNAIVVSAEYIPEGTEILIHQNGADDNYRIFNYEALSGSVTGSDWGYYSLPIDMCYLYREGNDWLPLKGWATALRVFKPYEGLIQNIEPTQLKDVLYITKGDYEGNVVHTITYVDFEIIFQGINGQEDRRIRLRPNGNEKTKHEAEVTVINHDLTEKVKQGKLFVGLNTSDAKPLKEYPCLNQ